MSSLSLSCPPLISPVRPSSLSGGEKNELPNTKRSGRKKRTFKKFSYRGVDLENLLDMPSDDLVKLFRGRIRRRLARGLTRKPMALIKKLLKAKREAPAGEKPEPVKTHLRNMVIMPEMIGSVVAVYNGKVFNQIEVKPEMIGHYLAEFSITYKPVKHGVPALEKLLVSNAGKYATGDEVYLADLFLAPPLRLLRLSSNQDSSRLFSSSRFVSSRLCPDRSSSFSKLLCSRQASLLLHPREAQDEASPPFKLRRHPV